MTALLPAQTLKRRAVLNRRIRLFAAATITYNLIEAVADLWAGNVADSSALIGFGLDSVIEVSSALALSWQFSANDPERCENLTLRIIAISFFALAAFVTVDAVGALTGGEKAQHSTPGIVIAALSLAIMPVLSWAQRRAGREFGSRTAVLTATKPAPIAPLAASDAQLIRDGSHRVTVPTTERPSGSRSLTSNENPAAPRRVEARPGGLVVAG